MTRDEAIRTYRGVCNWDPSNKEAEKVINVYVALGMLKLDEPKSVEERARTVINNAVLGNPYAHAEMILNAIKFAGLQIVEK